MTESIANVQNYFKKTTESVVEAQKEHKVNIEHNKLFSSSRKAEYSYTRFLIMYLLYKNTDLSLNDIGSYFGKSDHTTIMNAIERIQELLDDMDYWTTMKPLTPKHQVCQATVKTYNKVILEQIEWD